MTRQEYHPARTARLDSLPLGKRTLVMGIINVTPDSFSGDGLAGNPEAARLQAVRMCREGADLLDVGGQSTRPGSQPVSVDEELSRVVPLIELLRGADSLPVPISVDTNRGSVAEAALRAGADIVNDISGLRDDPSIADITAKHGAGLVLMHIQGTPATMQQSPHYDNLLEEVTSYLRESIRKAVTAGVPRERIWVDPGIGFGKTLEHNLELLGKLSELRALGCPILVGTSRKGFLGKLLAPLHAGQAPPPEKRIMGTAATLAISIANGADIVRVHDVGEAVEVSRVSDAIVRGSAE